MTVREMGAISVKTFKDEILLAAQPVVFRGLVADWPAVRAATDSDEALFAYLSGFDSQQVVTTLVGDPDAGGRFFYNADLTGFNFHAGGARLRKSFDFLLAQRSEDRPTALAVQSVPTNTYLPGFADANRLALLDPSVEPRLWIGNRVIVAAHQDPYDNLACVVAGRRRFTLFPPHSVGDLYIGPFEHTPGGPPISMVSFDDPDLEQHPRFAQAMASALVVELGPGDALYIPYLWWHHVRSLAPINVLANYWWSPPQEGRGQPYDAFLHAVLALRALPEPHRAAWKTLFDHYVFGPTDLAMAHLPLERRGMLAENLEPSEAERLLRALAERMSR